jgi:hypothetical protein
MFGAQLPPLFWEVSAGWLHRSSAARTVQFHDLRSEVIQKSVLYANVRAAAKQNERDGSFVELTEIEMDRLQEA